MVVNPETGRSVSCICGQCRKCKNREYNRKWWASLPLEQRQEIIARRDKEQTRANDRARHERDREARNAAVRERRRQRVATEEGREKEREYHREWGQRNPAKIADKTRRWREENPEKYRAHTIVSTALNSGRLEKRPCEVCGSRDVHAHHDDYSKPLEVRWLCPIDHRSVHAEAA